MEPFLQEAPHCNGASSSSSPTASSDSPGTATSGTVRSGSVATTTSQPSAPPPSVPAACLPCRTKHLRCDGGRPCSRCTATGIVAECAYVASRRGYKGPRRTPNNPTSGANPNKRHASSSPPPPYAGTTPDSCPMMLGHAPVTMATPSVHAFNPSVVLPDQSQLSFPSTPSVASIPVYRNNYMMDTTAMALATQAAPPIQPPAATLPERCFEAFYHYFYAGHPFVLPKGKLLELLKSNSEPNLPVVMAAMRYIGSLYVDAGPAKARFLDEAIQLCYAQGVRKDGFLIQALLLIIVGLDGSCEQAKARELLAICERYAIEIDLNKREFAVMHGRGDPIIEESWRRTWWDLYVCDGMIAGVHRVTNFLLFDILTDVGLPCEEEEYRKGCIPSPMSLEDFDDKEFQDEDREFSSFAYRVAAARNLGRLMRMPNVMFPDAAEVDKMEAHLSNWRMHLPDNKRDDLDKNCQLDEMMFQAHFITHACTIMLHQPLSQLDSSPVQAVNSCAPHRPVRSGDQYNAHTKHTVTAACEISKMVTQAVPVTSHTHFFTCVVTLSSIVHMSKWALYMIEDEADLRQQIRLNIGALNKLSKVWKAANTAWGQVKGVAQEIYRQKKAQQITPAFWVGYTQEQMMTSIQADDSIMNEFNQGLIAQVGVTQPQ
ncbi:hypothetical protein QBC32DRAFT_94972 [Pseudoneurospora amorphoporcata]|uniref:Zn(2)-C6 fungal-type domain-containing protein n=1 Tax=Pseudoneurospora amorphoporcata TaxID=241081 RepID=A0AAN6NY53_9PEZI|nr:hypothetical protein QBC32DRAFT_94972 [Pseudoneurospora amorphoporcata]